MLSGHEENRMATKIQRSGHPGLFSRSGMVQSRVQESEGAALIQARLR